MTDFVEKDWFWWPFDRPGKDSERSAPTTALTSPVETTDAQKDAEKERRKKRRRVSSAATRDLGELKLSKLGLLGI